MTRSPRGLSDATPEAQASRGRPGEWACFGVGRFCAPRSTIEEAERPPADGEGVCRVPGWEGASSRTCRGRARRQRPTPSHRAENPTGRFLQRVQTAGQPRKRCLVSPVVGETRTRASETPGAATWADGVESSGQSLGKLNTRSPCRCLPTRGGSTSARGRTVAEALPDMGSFVLWRLAGQRWGLGCWQT